MAPVRRFGSFAEALDSDTCLVSGIVARIVVISDQAVEGDDLI